MRIAAYQFSSGSSIEENMVHIRSGAAQAAAAGAQMVCFHECALCGYPPVETLTENIAQDEINAALQEISALAAQYHMYILVGTVTVEDGRRYNSAVVYGPDGNRTARYDKRALWGWDCENFTHGARSGVFEADGVRMGVRICFDVRFPELFRELYSAGCELCVVLFSDTAENPDTERYAVMKGHLVTRAAENVMTILSVNSTSRSQTAPTAVFDRGGRTLTEAVCGKEQLIFFDYESQGDDFGTLGRRTNIDRLLSQKSNE